MECLSVSKLPAGSDWVYEIKLDGYRAVAIKVDGEVSLYSRQHKSFNSKYPLIVEALENLPDGTVLDGEIVALDDAGRPVFDRLQNVRSEADNIHYFVFDLLCYKYQDTTRLPLIERRKLMKSVLKFKTPRVVVSEYVEATAEDILAAVRKSGLEGIIGKRRGSIYEPGKRSGAWIKYRVNRGQELVVGGYVPGAHGLDSIIVGYFREDKLTFVGKVRNGFVPASRRQVFAKLRPLVIAECPFKNLPEMHRSRWGEGLTKDKMKECVWVRPEIVAQIEFLEWTERGHLRLSKFARLREDKEARSVVKEEG